MHKIEVDGKVFIYLDHQKLINEAYSGESGVQEYIFRKGIFDYRPKKEKNESDGVPRKKRKVDDEPAVVDNSEFTQVIKALEQVSSLLPPKESIEPIARCWEQFTADDFPNFKGANGTKSFQKISKLIDRHTFMVPPLCRFINNDIRDLPVYIDDINRPFDVIVVDPPWRNKYIRRLKRHQLGYNMMDSDELMTIPFDKLIKPSTVVLIWCTNCKQHQDALLNEIFPKWQIRLIHTLKWLKLNTLGEPIVPLTNSKDENKKQPYEMLYIASHRDAEENFGANFKEIEMLMSIPSIIHSHKPPLLTWLRTYFPLLEENPNCFELFSRYLHPHFTSFGLEVLKLMDHRLYLRVEPEVLDGT